MARVSVQVPIEQSEPEAEAQNYEPINDANYQSVSNQATPSPAAQPVYAPRPSLVTGKRLTLAGFVVLVIIVFAFMVVLKDRNQLKQQVKQAATQASTPANDALKYKEAVSKLVDVPSDVTPLANTPPEAEITKLKSENPIYANVKTGDVFVIYTLTDKSLFLVVYRPGVNKIILATAGNQASSTSTPTGSQPTAPSATKPKQ